MIYNATYIGFLRYAIAHKRRELSEGSDSARLRIDIRGLQRALDEAESQ